MYTAVLGTRVRIRIVVAVQTSRVSAINSREQHDEHTRSVRVHAFGHPVTLPAGLCMIPEAPYDMILLAGCCVRSGALVQSARYA